VAYDREPSSLLAGGEVPPALQRRDYADQTAAAIDNEVQDIVERVFQHAQDLLRARRGILDRAAKKLLEKETLEQADLEQLLREEPEDVLHRRADAIGIR
jgi:cell division protease FtsH